MDPGILAALILAGGGLAGIYIGGRIASNASTSASKISADVARDVSAASHAEAEADRKAAREARLTDRMIVLASEALARSERHRHEIWEQARGWDRVVAGKDRPGSIPEVHLTDDILDAVGGLYIVAHKDTADAGWNLYRSLREGLDTFAYNAERDRPEGGEVYPRTTGEGLVAADLQYLQIKTAFLDAVRVELGLPKLVSGPPFPTDDETSEPADSSPPALTTVTVPISGSAYTSPPSG